MPAHRFVIDHPDMRGKVVTYAELLALINRLEPGVRVTIEAVPDGVVEAR